MIEAEMKVEILNAAVQSRNFAAFHNRLNCYERLLKLLMSRLFFN